MPYTPPSQQSPGGSGPQSPTLTHSRSHSFGETLPHTSQLPTSPPTRPGLTRLPSSTSYLHRHRRTPSLSKSNPEPTGHAASPGHDGQVHPSTSGGHGPTQSLPIRSRSLHQSPPPVNGAAIPPGAVVSPPDSMQVSDEDETTAASDRKPRGRHLSNLAELQAAIRNIERDRDSQSTGSPEQSAEATQPGTPPNSSVASPPARPMPTWGDRTSVPAPLSREARKISHSRSSTESAIELEAAGIKTPSSNDDSDESSSPSQRPIMVRKKSGELVKPALRPASRRRPSSMPGTPTYAKAVHFDAHLEHVRHFLQVDRPLAVSAGSSPVETYDTESEYPWSGDEGSRGRPPPYRWEMVLSNFPENTPERQSAPVRVERVYLSKDNKNLVGAVAVANLSFQKSVVARFTLDYWKTTSEVVAEYDHNIRHPIHDGYDRFHFSIKLADLAKLETKTLFFCVRYNAVGQEFWDNNNWMNYRVSFVKKATSSSSGGGACESGLGARPVRAIPRNRSTSSRPWSMPASFDDFGDGFDTKYDFSPFRMPASKLVDGARRRNDDDDEDSDRERSSRERPMPDFPTRRAGQGGQAFGNRYDFGASLSAAIQASTGPRPKHSTQPRSAHGKGGKTHLAAVSTHHEGAGASPAVSPTSKTATPHVEVVSVPLTKTATGPHANHTTTTPPAFSRPESYISEKPSQQSKTYLELIDRYCFVRSGTPKIAGTT